MRFGIALPRPLPSDTVEIGVGIPLDASHQIFRRIVRLVREGRVVREFPIDVVAGTSVGDVAALVEQQLSSER